MVLEGIYRLLEGEKTSVGLLSTELHAMVLMCQVRCAHWCNSGMTLIGQLRAF